MARFPFQLTIVDLNNLKSRSVSRFQQGPPLPSFRGHGDLQILQLQGGDMLAALKQQARRGGTIQ